MEVRTIADQVYDHLELNHFGTIGFPESMLFERPLIGIAAGLGTFGLSDGFISEVGKAVRLTSYVVQADLPVTERGDRGPYDWCLYYAKGTCGACMKRCPVGAISKDGHDKNRCASYEDEAIARYGRHTLSGATIFLAVVSVRVLCHVRTDGRSDPKNLSRSRIVIRFLV